MFKILIAEDDRELRQLFQHILLKNGYTVKGVSDGQEALNALEKDYYDLIISDIMMPNMDGYELVRSLRDAGDSIPVLMVTAKDAFDDMRMGFLSGTDDYMIKPVNINELVLRVGALLRRAQMINERKQRIGDTILECDSLTVSTSSENMVLPQKEFMLLYKMVSFPGKIFTRQQLMDDIWGYDSASDAHTVDVHIGRLRERFRDNPDFKIVTIRGVGYKVVSMKKKPFENLSIRIRFILIIMLELICVSLISWIVMDVLHISDVPYIVWIILASVIAGGVLNNFLSIRYFGPVLKLEKAMQQVAEGDFSVRLKTGKHLKEIQDIYSNFNLMVQELEATEILQTDFVSNVSHEFKTPISAIEGYATLLQDSDMPISEEQEQYIDKILFNTGRLSHLAGNILLLSKIEHQAIQTRQNWYRLDEQIRQSIVMLEPKWSEKELEFDVDMVDVEYLGNENLICHVWDNLLSNAIKFSPCGGTIYIRMMPEGEKIRFSIENEGPQIREDSMKHIFDKFYQCDSSHKQEGNGLGLALVKQILNLCKGTISVENIPGSGCRFTVIL